MELDGLNLESLSVEQIRKLISIVSKELAKKYVHQCSEQVTCSQCEISLCYACYNLHVKEVHGLRAAQFNEKINTGSFFLPEKKEIKVKKTINKIGETKIKIKTTKKIKTPWGNFTVAQIAKILDEMGAI